MDVTLRLWHVVAATAVVALALGLMLGRYALPAGSVRAQAAATTPSGNELLQAESAAFRRRANESAAQARVRAAVPGLEAYNADHATGYAGATLTKLQASYDAGIEEVTIVHATSSGYCVESTVGQATYHKAGPAGDIVPGHCP